MCPTKQKHRPSAFEAARKWSRSTNWFPNWISQSVNGGPLQCVDLHTGTNGWASLPGEMFSLRSKNYFTKRQKSPSGEHLLAPTGVVWIRSNGKLDNALARPDNRLAQALKKAQSDGKSLKSFILTANLQTAGNGKDYHSAVFYYATEDPIPFGSLLPPASIQDREQDRERTVGREESGWELHACLLGKALTCNYHRGANYLEINVHLSSSAIATAILRLALGYVSSLTVDMGFLVEAQAEDQLPERLIGAVRVCQIDMSSATVVEIPTTHLPQSAVAHRREAKVNQ